MEIAQKSTLAKLLATENVSLEHKNVPTAYFDLKDRKVVLPILKSDISPAMYDLFIGHEVSHALNTPLEGWHDSQSLKGKGFKSFLNVVEDARIERDIKKRFPGLTKSFYKGYREMFEMDFFGLGDNDINDYPLIDRINLFYKVGQFANVQFTDEEQVFVDRVAKCETWDDVVAVSEDLYDYAQNEESEMDLPDAFHGDSEEGENDSEDPMPMPSDDSDADTEEETGEGESHDSDDSQESDAEEENNEGDVSDEESDEESDDADMIQSEESGEPMSLTDQAFRDNEEQLIETGSRDIHWVNFPKLDTKKWVNNDPWNGLEDHLREKVDFFVADESGRGWRSFDSEDAIPFETAAELLVNGFTKKNRAFINMMVSQFEAKRKAQTLKKAREHRTGDLNMDKLWATKLTEDVFLSTTVTPDGKNHGMLMVIDFSGSMYDKLQATIEQMLIQVSFCKKVNIPFEVYSFTNNRGNNIDQHVVQNQKAGDLQIVDNDLCINRLIHSGMGAKEFKKTMMLMLMIGSGYSTWNSRQSGLPFCEHYSFPSRFGLGGTPLDATVLMMRDIALEFRRKNGIDVLNTLFLTDGGNTGSLGMGGDHNAHTRSYSYGNDRVAIRENGVTTLGKTESRVWNTRFSEQVCQALIAHYDKTTGSRTVNYFLSDANRARTKQEFMNIYGWNSESDFDKKWKTEWLSDGYIQIDGLDGFPTAFCLRSKDLGEDVELEVKGDKKGDLVRGFKKFQKTKTTSRKFLTKFIEKIA